MEKQKNTTASDSKIVIMLASMLLSLASLQAATTKLDTVQAISLIGAFYGDGSGITNLSVAGGSITVGTNGTQLATGITNLTITAGANATVSGTSTAGSAIITITGTPPGAGIDEATATTIANTAAQNATNPVPTWIGNATNATVKAAARDGAGNVITSTYATKTDLQNATNLTAAQLVAEIGTTAVQNATHAGSADAASAVPYSGITGASSPILTNGHVAAVSFPGGVTANVTGTASGNLTSGSTLDPTKLSAGTAAISISGNAATATKATQDASGNTITSTYATVTALNNSTGGISATFITDKLGAASVQNATTAASATSVPSGITITNGGSFAQMIYSNYMGSSPNWDTYYAPALYCATNNNFTLTVCYNGGKLPAIIGSVGTPGLAQFPFAYITNTAGPSAPKVVTLSGAWSTCLQVTGGMANAFAVTNDAWIILGNPGSTNPFATTR